MRISEFFQNTGKEEPKAPLFLLDDVILAVSAAVYAGGGGGQRFVVQVAFVVIILLLVLRAGKWIAAGLTVFLALCLYQPAIMGACFSVAALFFITGRHKHGILVLAGSALQMLGVLNPFYIPLILSPFVAASAVNRWNLASRVAIALASILSILSLLPTAFPLAAPSGHQDFAYPYRIDVAGRFKGAHVSTSYTSIDDKGDPIHARTLVLEHDPPHDLAEHNWSQKRLWTRNYYFGAPLYRIGAGFDGFLFSNIGCRVDGPLIRLLGEAHMPEHNAFISRNSGKVVFSDSDFLNNGAVGYQKHLNSALFGKFSLSHSLLYVSVLALALGIISRTKVMVLPLLVVSASAIVFYLHNQKIDIRLSGGEGIWPHSKGVAGIGAEITEETGIKIVSMHGRADILGVSRDSVANYNGEKVVVMEGGSEIIIHGKKYQAMDLPMGESQRILDAIPIRTDGSDSAGECIVRSGDVILIGTNSGRSNWRMIYDAAN